MLDPIIITGCARSGTSLVAGIVNKCGAWGGDMFGPSQHNQRGYFENKLLREQVIKPYLRYINVDPLGQDPLPNINELSYQPLKKQMIKIVREQGYKKGPWFYKCAKACLIWMLLDGEFPNAKWIIVRREPKDIVASCMRTGFMQKRKDTESWRKWVDHHLDRFEEMRNSSMQTWEVWPQKLIDGDVSEMYNAIEAVGLKWDEQAVSDFVAPELYHGA